MNRKPKIVATIGPASQERATLAKMIEAGMDVARLNFSHGTHEEHGVLIERIRSLSAEMHKPITILQDLQGPKLRVGDLTGGAVQINPGDFIVLTSKPDLESKQV